MQKMILFENIQYRITSLQLFSVIRVAYLLCVKPVLRVHLYQLRDWYDIAEKEF